MLLSVFIAQSTGGTGGLFLSLLQLNIFAGQLHILLAAFMSDTGFLMMLVNCGGIGQERCGAVPLTVSRGVFRMGKVKICLAAFVSGIMVKKEIL